MNNAAQMLTSDDYRTLARRWMAAREAARLTLDRGDMHGLFAAYCDWYLDLGGAIMNGIARELEQDDAEVERAAQHAARGIEAAKAGNLPKPPRYIPQVHGLLH